LVFSSKPEKVNPVSLQTPAVTLIHWSWYGYHGLRYICSDPNTSIGLNVILV
jgi:hypothetical protein